MRFERSPDAVPPTIRSSPTENTTESERLTRFEDEHQGHDALPFSPRPLAAHRPDPHRDDTVRASETGS